MVTKTVLCSLGIVVAAAGQPAGPPSVALTALVGAYDVTDAAGVPAGALVVRDASTMRGGYEVVLSLGHPHATYRTIYHLRATEHPEHFRVVRSETDPALLEQAATARLVGESLVISSWLVTRSGERVEVRDILGPANAGDLVVRTMVWPPSATAPTVLRVLMANRVQ